MCTSRAKTRNSSISKELFRALKITMQNQIVILFYQEDFTAIASQDSLCDELS